ncbi:MAG TPA: TIM barrel protein [Verrucomicrobiae bacterium]|jgi:sugar phosphate isomerase/epimerase
MQLGISSYTFGWAVGVRGHEPARPLDEHGLLDKCRVHGVKLLQIGDNLPLHTFEAARLDRLAVRASREGIQLEVGARRLTVERVAEYAVIARRLDAKLIRFVIDDADYHPSPTAVTAILRESATLLDGLTLGIENHDRFPAASLRRMIESAGDNRIGVCLDTANSLGAGEGLDAVLAILGPLTVNLHIKDFHIERMPHLMGFSVSGRPAGSGFLNVPDLLQRLSPFARCHTAVLELWTPPEPNVEQTIAKESSWAGQSLEYLKPFFT